MKLPKLEEAWVEEKKVTLYLLNEQHEKGSGKAKFFSQFGFSMAEWKQLADALIVHAQQHDVVKSEETKHGTRHVIEGELVTPIDRKPLVRSVWFIATGESRPRLVTAYPLEQREQEND